MVLAWSNAPDPLALPDADPAQDGNYDVAIWDLGTGAKSDAAKRSVAWKARGTGCVSPMAPARKRIRGYQLRIAGNLYARLNVRLPSG
jgi:hypothetical protein